MNKATAKLFPIADTPQAMLDLGEEGVREKIKTIGLFNAKAKNVIALSRLLIERHAGEVPRDRDALEALPGARSTLVLLFPNRHQKATMAQMELVAANPHRLLLLPQSDLAASIRWLAEA